jgi:tRNA A22 N-methylase
MSGTLMARICGASPLRSVRQIVAQANTGARALRAWACENAWHLQDERVVEEGGRFFTLCVFGRDDANAYAVAGWSQADLLTVGPVLLARRDPVAYRYYRMQHARMRALPRAAELAMWAAACAHCEGVS